jgi:hypothetical protein
MCQSAGPGITHGPSVIVLSPTQQLCRFLPILDLKSRIRSEKCRNPGISRGNIMALLS